MTGRRPAIRLPANAVPEGRAPCRVHDACARCFGQPEGGQVDVSVFGAVRGDVEGFSFLLCRGCLAEMLAEFAEGDDSDHDEDDDDAPETGDGRDAG